jgi:hypothetical protein
MSAGFTNMDRLFLVLLAMSIIVLLADISYSVALLLARPPMENSFLVELIHELKPRLGGGLFFEGPGSERFALICKQITGGWTYAEVRRIVREACP